MSGKGKLKWINGNMYEGLFSNGKFQGFGTMVMADGSSTEGLW